MTRYYCGMATCDVIGELHARDIYYIRDTIFYYLDWSSLKNASLVSKAWREAALVALRIIISRDNPKWSSEQKKLWQKTRNHLSHDFQVSQEDPQYTRCFANSMHLAFERIQKGYTSKLEFTVDYLAPLIFHGFETFEMNEKFIVAFSPMTQLLNFWSRRTLFALKMDKEFQMRRYPHGLGGVGLKFQLLGNHLTYGDIFSIEDDYKVINLTKVDLDAKCRRIDEGAVTVTSARLESPNAYISIYHLGVIEDFILFILKYSTDESKYRVSVLWKAEESGKKEIDLRSTMLHIPAWDISYDLDCFFDANYFVAKWNVEKDPFNSRRFGFRSYSLHPRKAGHPVELRPLASFELVDAVQFDYKDGLLAAASRNGMISFVDVSNGAVVRKVSTPIKNMSGYSSRLKFTQNYLVCCQRMRYPILSTVGTIYVWDVQSITRLPAEETEFKPIFAFDTLIGGTFDFKADEMGMMILMKSDPDDTGVQVLNFLPACNRCKRVANPALLKKCSRCKLATYCSKDCQAADWKPHHKAICSKLEPMNLRST